MIKSDIFTRSSVAYVSPSNLVQKQEEDLQTLIEDAKKLVLSTLPELPSQAAKRLKAKRAPMISHGHGQT